MTRFSDKVQKLAEGLGVQSDRNSEVATTPRQTVRVGRGNVSTQLIGKYGVGIAVVSTPIYCEGFKGSDLRFSKGEWKGVFEVIGRGRVVGRVESDGKGKVTIDQTATA